MSLELVWGLWVSLEFVWGLWVSLELVWGLWVSLELVLGVVGRGGRDWPLVFMSEGIADGG